jgi:hypothetical protein
MINLLSFGIAGGWHTIRKQYLIKGITLSLQNTNQNGLHWNKFMKEYIRLSNVPAKYRLTFYKDSKYDNIHREKAKPAVIWNDGTKWHCYNGMLYKQIYI